MKASKKLKKLQEEHNYLKTKIDQLEKLRDQDRSSNTWQIIRTLKNQKNYLLNHNVMRSINIISHGNLINIKNTLNTMK